MNSPSDKKPGPGMGINMGATNSMQSMNKMGGGPPPRTGSMMSPTG